LAAFSVSTIHIEELIGAAATTATVLSVHVAVCSGDDL